MGSALTYLSDSAVTTVKIDKTPIWASDKRNAPLQAGTASMQGWRRSMEDAHFSAFNEEMKVYLFGVFDGHGGSGVSRYCAERLPELIFNNPNFKERSFDLALHESFLDIDIECQEPEVQEKLFQLHRLSKKISSGDDLTKIEIHLSFETILDLFLGDPSDPVNHPSDPFKVFLDEYVIPDPWAIVLPSPNAVGVTASPSDEHGDANRKRKRRNATLRYGERPPVYTAEPRSPWGVIASKLRQTVVNKRAGIPLDSSVFTEMKELMDMLAVGDPSKDSPLLRISPDIDWSNMDPLLEDPLHHVFEGLLSPLFHVAHSTDIPWVYSIHPIDLLCVLNNNHFVGEGPSQRRCVSDDQGCTANVCLLALEPTPILYCANAGDSRAILVRNSHAIPLSVDHKPSLPGERRRVLHAGGRVLGKEDPRIQGDLNLSRAIGDWRHKQNSSLPIELQMISPRPDISITELAKKDEYIVLGCDGVWERFSSADMATFVHALGSATEAATSPRRRSFLRQSLGATDNKVPNNQSVDSIASAICMSTVRKATEFPGVPIGVTIGCDNMSVIVVRIGDRIRERISSDPPTPEEEPKTLPVVSYGAQVPDDWKPPTPTERRIVKKKKISNSDS
jgi:serine/threonine protein phosphatase PrpC